MKSVETIPSCTDCAFKALSLFRHLTDEQLTRISYQKECLAKKRGSVLYGQGNRVSGFYCVSRGIIKQFKTGIDGKEQIIRFAKAGDIVGYRSVLSKDVACTTAKVLDDSLLCYIPGVVLFELVQENPDFAMDLMQLTCKELEESNSYITDIAQKTVRERLAEVLLLLKDKFGLDAENTLMVTLTREELANFVGTATESVIRLLSEFKQDKLIALNGRKIQLLDIPKLTKISNVF